VLRPQDNATREAKRLDGLWSFAADPHGIGRDEGWWRDPLANARPIPVPSSFNDLYVDRELHDHVGDVWYQRDLYIPRGWEDRRVVLRFDAATHRASVWLDDHLLAEHEGGYTPFEGELGDLATAGTRHVVTVVVNNELTWTSLPPGIVELTADGRRLQRQYHDFFNYAGLHRSVWLCATPRVHLADVTVVTDIRGATGIVSYAVQVEGLSGQTIRASLRDDRGEVVAESTGSEGQLSVDDAQWWQPGDPYLYELQLDLVDSGLVADTYSLPVGIRTVRVEGSRFLINGQPFYFRGFGMHEDLNVRGRGHDDASMIHDFSLLRWVGANSLRTSHYPYAEEVLDLADRLGIVVIDETSAVGLNLGVGGGFFLGGPRTTFSEETIGSATQAVHQHAIEELIARDKNHPSVVLWCLANEPESHTDEARAYFEPLFAAARAADPSRPVGFVNMMFAPAGECQLTSLTDVVMINRYYGWYVEPGDLDAAERALEAELRRWSEHGKPIVVTEYGADAMSGLHSIDEVPWSEEFQASLLDTYHRVFDRVDAVVGEHVWNFADFATPPSFIRVDGNRKGVFSRDRRPKAAAHHLRRRWTGAS
jgi:beta-glucuronidase